MQDTVIFTGFPHEAFEFLRDLKAHNSRAWFQRHRAGYENYILAPARAFVVELGSRLRERYPGIIAVPRINRSIFRLNRDTRFSSDKSPYKTHLALWFWEGSRPRMENSGFYIQIDAERLMLGTGIYQFPGDLLEPYRKAVLDRKSGPALGRITERISKTAGYNLGGIGYKRVPSGYDREHPRAELLKYKGLYAGNESGLPDEIEGREFAAYCIKRFEPIEGLHRWLVGLGKASQPVFRSLP